jgi:hypothetical protein
MTYPPQPPRPPYPPHGQYPQQPPQGQYPGYPPPGYPPYGGPPPKKGNGLLIGLIAGGVAFLLVVVFVITGFFAPGFLVANERPDGPAGNSPPLDLNSGSVAAGKFILAVLGDDEAGARDAACASAEGIVADAAKTLGSRNAHLSAGSPIQAAANEIRVPLNGTIGSSSKSVHGELRVLRIQETYCISEITMPS